MAKKKTSDSTPAAPKAPATRRRAPAVREAASDSSTAGAVNIGAAAQDPTYDEIAEAAYRRYLSRGGSHGRDFDDWVEAERELRSRKS